MAKATKRDFVQPNRGGMGVVPCQTTVIGGILSIVKTILTCLLPAFALLAGCATPYGDEGITGGISEADLGNGKIQIKVVGNDWTSSESMEAMWRQKAATIAATRGSGKYETLQFNVGREAYGLNILGGAKVAKGIIQIN